MPLVFTGRTAHTTDLDTSIQAMDSVTEMTIVVIASQEAIDDHGLSQVKDVASNKYDNGKFESDGSISIRTADF